MPTETKAQKDTRQDQNLFRKTFDRWWMKEAKPYSCHPFYGTFLPKSDCNRESRFYLTISETSSRKHRKSSNKNPVSPSFFHFHPCCYFHPLPKEPNWILNSRSL
ncbi:hypothetical protein AVEN_6657-1 [Araneus ventricosus]|uniref:Uncharacterized protein n=1 Tax=Araneus ventricosus TaxID=182803 RepID=A0A4Y2H275_ARAVE|nr:hypothetical protein AVEN_6657-1 [Araneus ventricosus]